MNLLIHTHAFCSATCWWTWNRTGWFRLNGLNKFLNIMQGSSDRRYILSMRTDQYLRVIWYGWCSSMKILCQICQIFLCKIRCKVATKDDRSIDYQVKISIEILKSDTIWMAFAFLPPVDSKKPFFSIRPSCSRRLRFWLTVDKPIYRKKKTSKLQIVQ